MQLFARSLVKAGPRRVLRAKDIPELRAAIADSAPGDHIRLDPFFVADVDLPITVGVPGLSIAAATVRGRGAPAHFTGAGTIFEVNAPGVHLANISFRGARAAVYCTAADLLVEHCRMYGVASGVTSISEGITRLHHCEMREGRIGISVANGTLLASSLLLDEMASAIVYQGPTLLLDHVEVRRSLVAIRAREVKSGSTISRSCIGGKWRALQLESEEDGQVSLTLDSVTVQGVGSVGSSTAVAIEVKARRGRCELKLEGCRVGADEGRTERPAFGFAGDGSTRVTCTDSVIEGIGERSKLGKADVRCAPGCVVEGELLAAERTYSAGR